MPRAGDSAEPVFAEGDGKGGGAEWGRTVSPQDEAEVPELPAGLVPGALLDPRLEFIVTMELVDPVPASQIIDSQLRTLERVSKPIHWVHFNERNREWERIPSDSEVPVRRLRVGLQLVDRTGPVSEACLLYTSRCV